MKNRKKTIKQTNDKQTLPVFWQIRLIGFTGPFAYTLLANDLLYRALSIK